MDTENKFLSSLSYLSIFFLPIIFPVVVIALTSNINHPAAHRNAITAFWLHLVSFLLVPLAFGIGVGATVHGVTASGLPVGSIIAFGFVGLIGIALLALFIYNIYRGVKIWVE